MRRDYSFTDGASQLHLFNRALSTWQDPDLRSEFFTVAVFAKKSPVFLGSRSLIRLGDCSAIFAPARYAHSRAGAAPNAEVQTGSRSRPIRARTAAQIPIRTTTERPSNSPAHSHPRQWPGPV